MASYDAAALKAEAEKASMMRRDESPIQAAISRIETELEYLGGDIGGLDEKLIPVQRPQYLDGETSSGESEKDAQSPLAIQLEQIWKQINRNRMSIRQLVDQVDL